MKVAFYTKIPKISRQDALLFVIVTITYGCGITFGIIYALHQHLLFKPHPNQVNAVTIIGHNILILAFLFLGIISGGLLSLFMTFINGLALGIALGTLALQGYLSASLLSLLPHGLIEVFAFLIATSGDLSIVCYFYKKIVKRLGSQKQIVVGTFPYAALFINLVAVILLIISGEIEATITPVVVRYLFYP